jgi:hypothetical protein
MAVRRELEALHSNWPVVLQVLCCGVCSAAAGSR